MPKALSPFADDDEKTTIENGWEEEASTTVEQGEVAEKIRTLGLRPITGVTGALDEPTVDDQRANAALSLVTPPAIHARLIITAGNDQGQEIEVIPGKNYTIGRAIDNDVVLSDIAVSRKHFDLRFENNGWVLADRGSGNGTLINGNLEDNPFMLANGDAIEIGNTTFRFDFPSGIPRNSFNDLPSTNGFNQISDIVTRNADAYDMEEEPSTVAGKPLKPIDPEPPLTLGPAPSLPPPISPRPKTVPPPPPAPRAKPASSVPPGYPPALGSSPPHSNGASLPPVTLGAQQPVMLGPPQSHPSVPSLAPHHPTMLAQSQPEPLAALANVMPTTIPGQGPPVQPSQPQMHGLPFAYPNVNDHSALVHAKLNVRDATATAHVAPTPYSNGLVMQPYVAPTLSRRTKLLLGGAGLTVLAAIATIAIIKGVSGGSDDTVADSKEQPAQTQTKPTSQPIGKDKPKGKDLVTPLEDDKTAKRANDKKKAEDKRLADEKKAEEKRLADEKKAEDKRIADEKKRADDEARKLAQAKKDEDRRKADEARRKAEADRKAAALQAKRDDARRATARRQQQRKQVAVAKQDFSGVKEQAKSLYQAKKFNDAARLLRNAASGTSGTQASRLRNTAATYETFGRAYFNSNSSNPAVAWIAIQQALNFDNPLGGAYTKELQGKRSAIAGKAAIQLVAAKNYGEAQKAIRVAEAAGSSDAKIAKQGIENDARELYRQAKAEKDKDPQSAKTKLNRIKSIVGQGNSMYDKADRLLAKISG